MHLELDARLAGLRVLLAGLGGAQRQPAAASREQRLDRVGEALLDLAVGLAEAFVDRARELGDQAVELADGLLEIGDLRADVLRARALLLVLLAGERVDGSELGTPALETVEARRERGLLVRRQRLDGVDDRQPVLLGELAGAPSHVPQPLVELRVLHLERGGARVGAAQLRVACRLLGPARGELGGQLGRPSLERAHALGGGPTGLLACVRARGEDRLEPVGAPGERGEELAPCPRAPRCSVGLLGRHRSSLGLLAGGARALAQRGSARPSLGDGRGERGTLGCRRAMRGVGGARMLGCPRRRRRELGQPVSGERRRAAQLDGLGLRTLASLGRAGRVGERALVRILGGSLGPLGNDDRVGGGAGLRRSVSRALLGRLALARQLAGRRLRELVRATRLALVVARLGELAARGERVGLPRGASAERDAEVGVVAEPVARHCDAGAERPQSAHVVGQPGAVQQIGRRAGGERAMRGEWFEPRPARATGRALARNPDARALEVACRRAVRAPRRDRRRPRSPRGARAPRRPPPRGRPRARRARVRARPCPPAAAPPARARRRGRRPTRAPALAPRLRRASRPRRQPRPRRSPSSVRTRSSSSAVSARRSSLRASASRASAARGAVSATAAASGASVACASASWRRERGELGRESLDARVHALQLGARPLGLGLAVAGGPASRERGLERILGELRRGSECGIVTRIRVLGLGDEGRGLVGCALRVGARRARPPAPARAAARASRSASRPASASRSDSARAAIGRAARGSMRAPTRARTRAPARPRDRQAPPPRARAATRAVAAASDSESRAARAARLGRQRRCDVCGPPQPRRPAA